MMIKFKRSFVAFITALAALMVFALPASAAPSPTVAVFTGSATVTPGLFFPTGTPKDATWKFESVTGTCDAINVPDGLVGCQLGASVADQIEGELGAVASPLGENLGGWCGLSRGHSGTGEASAAGETIDVNDVGWITSAGGMLPIVGFWQDRNSDDNGNLVGLVNAIGGGPCLGDDPDPGATNFDVVGIIAIL
jgi:hypothetical protein